MKLIILLGQGSSGGGGGGGFSDIVWDYLVTATVGGSNQLTSTAAFGEGLSTTWLRKGTAGVVRFRLGAAGDRISGGYAGPSVGAFYTGWEVRDDFDQHAARHNGVTLYTGTPLGLTEYYEVEATAGGDIKYIRDGVLLYTQAGGFDRDMRFCASLYGSGDQIRDVQLQGFTDVRPGSDITWQNIQNVTTGTAKGVTIEKTAGVDATTNAWGTSVEGGSASTDCMVYCEVGSLTSAKRFAFGLTTSASISSYAGMQNRFEWTNTSGVTIYAGGTGSHGSISSLNLGDALMITVDAAGTVRFYVNNHLKFTYNTVPQTAAKRLGAAFHDLNAKLCHVRFNPSGLT